MGGVYRKNMASPQHPGRPLKFLNTHISPFPHNRLSCRDATRRQTEANRAEKTRRHLGALPRAIWPGTDRTWRNPGPTGSFLRPTTGDLDRNPANAPRQLWAKADRHIGGYVGRSLWRLRTSSSEDRRRQRAPADGHRPGGTLIPSPYLRVIRLASEMVARFGAELGMSPSARSSLSVDETLPESDQDWTSFDALLQKAANRG